MKIFYGNVTKYCYHFQQNAQWIEFSIQRTKDHTHFNLNELIWGTTRILRIVQSCRQYSMKSQHRWLIIDHVCVQATCVINLSLVQTWTSGTTKQFRKCLIGFTFECFYWYCTNWLIGKRTNANQINYKFKKIL